MRVAATDRVRTVIEQVRERRAGELTITIGTGCCESTAPFLYEDFWQGPDQAQIGEVAGVPVYAPEHLRVNYPGDDGVLIDVLEQPAESLSIETELDCRFILRSLDASAGDGSDSAATIDATFGVDLGQDADDACVAPRMAEPVRATVPTIATGGPSRVVGELPEALRKMRLR